MIVLYFQQNLLFLEGNLRKLVRDNIPGIIQRKKIMNDFEFHIASNEEYRNELKKKLQEEVDEFISSDDPLELVDILEVIYALANEFDISKEGLETMRKKKEFINGSFKKRIILKKIK